MKKFEVLSTEAAKESPSRFVCLVCGSDEVDERVHTVTCSECGNKEVG